MCLSKEEAFSASQNTRFYVSWLLVERTHIKYVWLPNVRLLIVKIPKARCAWFGTLLTNVNSGFCYSLLTTESNRHNPHIIKRKLMYIYAPSKHCNPIIISRNENNFRQVGKISLKEMLSMTELQSFFGASWINIRLLVQYLPSICWTHPDRWLSINPALVQPKFDLSIYYNIICIYLSHYYEITIS